MTDVKPKHPGSYCSEIGAAGVFATGRKAVCSPKNEGDRPRWRASEPAPAKKGRRRAAPTGLVVPGQALLEVPTPYRLGQELLGLAGQAGQLDELAGNGADLDTIRERAAGMPTDIRDAVNNAADVDDARARVAALASAAGLTQIGVAGQDMPFDRATMTVVAGDSRIQPGSPVTVVRPGYHRGGAIVARAAVIKAEPKVPTWQDLGSPQGPSPVGQVIGHLGGTYERLPGEPRRYRVITADGREILDALTADDARTVLRLDDWDRSRAEEDRNSKWRKTLGQVSGSWNYSTGNIDGFDEAAPEQREHIRVALKNWTRNKDHMQLRDANRIAEPHVNSVIRGAVPMDAVAAADMQALDLAFTMSKTKTPITLYRGYSDGSHILPDDWQHRSLTGLQWKNGGYTPGSAEEEMAESYVGHAEDRGFGVRVNLPEGFPAIAIPDEIGGLDNEGEIVLPRDLTFRVVGDNGAQGAYGMRWLDVEIVPDPT